MTRTAIKVKRTNYGTSSMPEHKVRDLYARGPSPRRWVSIPAPGERCPRCHDIAGRKPCLLCNPEAIPAGFGGSLA